MTFITFKIANLFREMCPHSFDVLIVHGLEKVLADIL
jgi:hypothetical protein